MIPLTSSNQPFNNARIVYSTAVAIVIFLGLVSRNLTLPHFIAENAGDALWAMMVYFVFRCLLVSKGLLTASWLSLLFSFAIEISQLYQADWINQIRGTVLGALILGHGFLFVDLIRYTVGILTASVIDLVIHKIIANVGNARITH
ncbi:ribosomal maturation YjgA family protein [Bacillus sp. T33-2]|uniref:ribosomal maturation YjgA family protein n=1 Tax=Bacillus sp. T33-2 TaxID=2054168 RepID=UPI000C784F47|nr:DUF2809 domain-containing protein [Bacillus sp. T33-2]PLR92003.1 DUF2809 domain-containing protein [Bacillus sp. T33-2]